MALVHLTFYGILSWKGEEVCLAIVPVFGAYAHARAWVTISHFWHLAWLMHHILSNNMPSDLLLLSVSMPVHPHGRFMHDLFSPAER